MTRAYRPVRRRTVLKTIGASAVASGVFSGVSVAQTTISVPGDESTIEEAIAAASPGDTIEVDPGTYPEDTRLYINDLDDLTLRGAGSDEVFVEPTGGSTNRGLEVNDSDGVTLEGFTLRDTPSGVYGFKLQFSDGLQLEDIRAVDNGRTGIDLNTTDDPTLREVSARGNDGAGIALRNLSGATVEDAETSDNAWGGLALWAPVGEEVTDTDVSQSSFTDEPAGIFAQYAGTYEDVSITHNDIEDNAVGVSIDDQFGTVADAGAIGVHLNNIVGNDTGIDNTGGGEPLPATCNWWGHPTGPEHDDNPKNNPKGDAVMGDVEFVPWNTRRIGRGRHPANSCVGGTNGRGGGQGN